MKNDSICNENNLDRQKSVAIKTWNQKQECIEILEFQRIRYKKELISSLISFLVALALLTLFYTMFIGFTVDIIEFIKNYVYEKLPDFIVGIFFSLMFWMASTITLQATIWLIRRLYVINIMSIESIYQKLVIDGVTCNAKVLAIHYPKTIMKKNKKIIEVEYEVSKQTYVSHLLADRSAAIRQGDYITIIASKIMNQFSYILAVDI